MKHLFLGFFLIIFPHYILEASEESGTVDGSSDGGSADTRSSGVSSAPTLGHCEDNPTDYAADDFKITFYNSGQGNCVLVNCPKNMNGRKEEFTSYLVDCGSSEGAGERGTEKRARQGKPPINKESIFADIDRQVSDNRGRDIIIIITHLDTDHFNWIAEMIKDDRVPLEKIKKVIVGYGNEWKKPEAQEEKKLKEALKKLEDLGVEVVYSTRNDRGLLFGLPVCGDQPPLVLSANAFKSKQAAEVRSGERLREKKDKNDDSIVLKFFYDDCSLVLPGDSGIETTHYIGKTHYEKRADKERRETTVLMAAHHGAMTHRTNEVSWIQKNNPKIGIFSAGDSGYKHPRCYVAGSFTDPHDRTGFKSIWQLEEERDNPSTCFYLPSRRVVPPYLRNRALFNTFDLGNITVVFRKSDPYRGSYVCLHNGGGERIIRGTSCSWGKKIADMPTGGGFLTPQPPRTAIARRERHTN